MRFVKEQVDLNPIVDTVFAIVSKAKEAKKELGEDKVVDATIGSLYNEEGKIDGGGDVFTTRWGNRVWLWTIQEPYMHIPEMGPVIVNMASVDNDGQKIKEIGTATIGVRPMNGMVHSLPYSYNLGEMYRYKYWAIVNN